MKKITNRQTFQFETATHGKISVYCHTYENQYNWGHGATVYAENSTDSVYGVKAKIVYYNRTWERFTYESILEKIIEKIFPNKRDKADREACLAQIKAIGDNESEKAKVFFENFAARFEKLNPEIKKRALAADVHFTTQEQAENFLKISEVFSVMLDDLTETAND